MGEVFVNRLGVLCYIEHQRTQRPGTRAQTEKQKAVRVPPD